MLKYAHPDIAFVVCVLGRYLSDFRLRYWRVTKKVMRYFQGTKDLMLTYQLTNTLDIAGFSDIDYACYVDDPLQDTFS